MIIGYARVSREDQNLHIQIDTLSKIGYDKIYQEKMCDTVTARLVLDKALASFRK